MDEQKKAQEKVEEVKAEKKGRKKWVGAAAVVLLIGCGIGVCILLSGK